MNAARRRSRMRLGIGIALALPVAAAAGASAAESGPAATAVLERALDGRAEAARRAAFSALAEYRCGRARADDRCATLLTVAARHDDWAIRLQALPYAVRSHARPAVRRAVLHDPSELVRRTGAKLLSDQAVREDREVFAALLDAADPLVREFAAGGLARLGDRQQVAVLNHALRSQDRELALEAARLLSSLDRGRVEDAGAVLRLALTDDDEVVRANAVYTMSEIPAPEWSETEATRALNDPSPLVRAAALEVLPSVRTTPSSADWPLGALARRWDAERIAALRLDILHAVAELSRRRVAPPMDVTRFAELVVRYEADERLRIAAEGVLAELDADAAARLLTLAEDAGRDVTERLLALSCLGRSCQAAVLAPLARLVEQPGGTALDREALRVGAAAAWVRLTGALEDHQCKAKADPA